MASTLAAVLLGVACSGDGPNNGGAADSSDPPIAGSVTATSTQPPAFAATPTRVALPARTPTGQPVGPLAVYSTEPGPGRASGLRELRAFDTGSGEEWAGFTFGGPDDPSRDEALGPGRLVVYATARRVSARSLEGGPARLLYEAPNGVSVTNISVSHSRTLVAVATFFKDSGGNSLSDLFFLDLGPAGPAPSPASRVPIHSTDPQLAGGFSGYFARPQWLVDDAGVMVVGARQRGGDPARADSIHEWPDTGARARTAGNIAGRAVRVYLSLVRRPGERAPSAG